MSAAAVEEVDVDVLDKELDARRATLTRRLTKAQENDLFYHNSQAKDAAAMKLIEFEKGSLAVADAGRSVLTQMDKDRNANLMFIFGNARSGKSFMMNCLLGKAGVFEVINTAEPCTKGVDISSYVMQHSDLVKHVDDAEQSPENPLIGLVDVEGQGAEDNSYDTMLALPLLLTSKVCLFNHKGAPTVTDMLSKLGVLARAADYVDLSDEKKGGDSDEDDDDDDDAVLGTKQRANKFGHLHVLFRDFSFDASREDVYNQLFTKEKVKVPKKSVKKNTTNAENAARAAQERNNIRQMLTDNFESIHVWLFKQPATADELKSHKELPSHLVDPEFAETVRELLGTVTDQLAKPTLFNNAPLNGPKLSQLVGQVTEVLNTGGSINVPSVYRAMERETVQRVAVECSRRLTKAVEGIKQKLPLPVADVKMLLDGATKDTNEYFDSELALCPLEQELKDAKAEIERSFSLEVEELYRQNKLATDNRMHEVVTREINDLKANFEHYCEKNVPVEDSKLLEDFFRQAKKSTFESIEDELKVLPDIEKASVMDRWHKEEVLLSEFLSLKILYNNSLLKDQRINKLQEEAIQIQKKLIGQNKKLEKYLEEEKANTIEMEKKLEALEKSKKEEEARVASAKEQEDRLREELERSKREVEEMRRKQREAEEELAAERERQKKKKCVIL